MNQLTETTQIGETGSGHCRLTMILMACCLCVASGAHAGAEPATPEGRSPVVVELFTSQGCSSCPPADELLREIGDRDDVIALSFHVDYWNRLGWRDPFSNESWSERQQRYARQQASDSVYTPQMVIDGQWQFVGSDRREAERLLTKSSRRAKPISLDVEVLPAGQGDEAGVEIVVRGVVSADADLRPADLLVAVVEQGLVTRVGRGENRSRTLHNDHVVRMLQRRPWVSDERQRVRLDLDESWRGLLQVVAFVQERNGLRIFGAARKVVRR